VSNELEKLLILNKMSLAAGFLQPVYEINVVNPIAYQRLVKPVDRTKKLLRKTKFTSLVAVRIWVLRMVVIMVFCPFLKNTELIQSAYLGPA
jgi:hypothetical protein